MNDIPRFPPTFLSRICRAALALFGWRAAIEWPLPPKAIIIVYPHTSNWDFMVGIFVRFAERIPLSFIGKDSLFRWPFGYLFRALGGVPVKRHERNGLVAQILAKFAEHDRLLLALAPEGTRSYVDHWKSGFYSLALAANVPVGLGYIDYSRRVVGVGEWITLSGNRENDLARLRAFYADKAALRPASAGAIRFRDDAQEGSSAAPAHEPGDELDRLVHRQ